MARPLTWTNWAGNQTASPVAIEQPRTEEELAAVVRFARRNGQTVKAVGTGHSFTDAACTTGRLVRLDQYAGIVSIDAAKAQVTVQAGMALTALNDLLDARGLAMANLGDIAYQTVSGAIATSTHGTGVTLGGLATTVIGMRVVDGEGTVRELDEQALSVARVGVGALGIVSTVTLQVVPSFNLRVVNEPMRLDAVLENLDAHVADNDHFEFFWVPHTGWALTKSNNRTTDSLSPRPRWREIRDDYLVENYAFGAVCRVGRRLPHLTPRLAKALPSSGRVSFVDKSYRVFASPRLVKFTEMEYSIPSEACAEALNRVRAFVKAEGIQLSFPVEVRFTAGDDIALSTASGSVPRCYIAVHMYQGMDNTKYFRGVEAIMNDYAGRPHWGKMHFQTATALGDRYPRWAEFHTLRDELDPDRVFANAYTDRVFGR